jgi:hypothetical protein
VWSLDGPSCTAPGAEARGATPAAPSSPPATCVPLPRPHPHRGAALATGGGARVSPRTTPPSRKLRANRSPLAAHRARRRAEWAAAVPAGRCGPRRSTVASSSRAGCRLRTSQPRGAGPGRDRGPRPSGAGAAVSPRGPRCTGNARPGRSREARSWRDALAQLTPAEAGTGQAGAVRTRRWHTRRLGGLASASVTCRRLTTGRSRCRAWGPRHARSRLERGRNPDPMATKPRDASREQLAFKALLPSRIRCTRWRFRPSEARCSPGFSTSPGLSTPTPWADASTGPPLTGLARRGRHRGGGDSSSGDAPESFSWLPLRVSVSAGADRSLTRPANPPEVRCLLVQRPR